MLKEKYFFRLWKFHWYFTKTENSNSKKASQDPRISIRNLRGNSDLFPQFVLKNYNEVRNTSTFPNMLKRTNVRCVYKKYSRNKLQNYRLVIILSNFSKVYETCLFNEMLTHFNNTLSKYQCGFRKRFSSQQRLIVFV